MPFKDRTNNYSEPTTLRTLRHSNPASSLFLNRWHWNRASLWYHGSFNLIFSFSKKLYEHLFLYLECHAQSFIMHAIVSLTSDFGYQGCNSEETPITMKVLKEQICKRKTLFEVSKTKRIEYLSSRKEAATDYYLSLFLYIWIITRRRQEHNRRLEDVYCRKSEKAL